MRNCENESFRPGWRLGAVPIAAPRSDVEDAGLEGVLAHIGAAQRIAREVEGGAPLPAALGTQGAPVSLWALCEASGPDLTAEVRG